MQACPPLEGWADEETPVLALTSIPAVILLIVVVYLAFGSFFTVPTAQAAVVTRFGMDSCAWPSLA